MSELDLAVKNPDANTFELTGVNIESNQKIKIEKSLEIPEAKDLTPSQQEIEPQKITLKINPEPTSKPQQPANLTLNTKKENTLAKSTVQFAAKKEEKLDKKPESSSKLAPIKPPSKKSNIRSSTSNSSMPRNVMKLERLKNVLEEIKSAKKDLKKTSSATGVRAFPELYEQKIVE